MIKEFTDKIRSLLAINKTLYFTLENAEHGNELWKSDGTKQGTMVVKNIQNGSTGSSPYNFNMIDNILYFAAYDGENKKLWKINNEIISLQNHTYQQNKKVWKVYNLNGIANKY